MGLSDIMDEVSSRSMEGFFPQSAPAPAPAAAPADGWGDQALSASGSASADGLVGSIPFRGALRSGPIGEKVGGEDGLHIDDAQKSSLWVWSKKKQLEEKAAKAEANGDAAEAEKARNVLKWSDPLSWIKD